MSKAKVDVIKVNHQNHRGQTGLDLLNEAGCMTSEIQPLKERTIGAGGNTGIQIQSFRELAIEQQSGRLPDDAQDKKQLEHSPSFSTDASSHQGKSSPKINVESPKHQTP